MVNKYTLRYNGNGATSGKMSDTKSCEYNKTYTLRKNTFVKKGYIFMGWAKPPKGALRYKDEEKVILSGNKKAKPGIKIIIS